MFNFLKNKNVENLIDENILRNNKDLENILNILKHSELFVSLIFIDLTFLNMKYNMDFGTSVKNLILDILENEKRKKRVVFISVTSSKIFIFTHSPLSSNFMKDVNQRVYDFIKKYIKKYNQESFSKEILFIVTKENDKHFIVGPFTNFFELINKALFLEKNLTNYRKSIQIIFKNQSKINKKELEEIENYVNLIRSEEYPKIVSNENLNINNLEKISLDYKDCLKNSQYLSNSINILKDITIKGYDYPYFFNKAFNEIIKYMLWFEMQNLQFIGFKIEKVYSFFNRNFETQNNTDVDNHKDSSFENENRISNRFSQLDNELIKFSTKEDLQNWYDSTIKYFFNLGLSEKEIDIANQIKYLISNYNSLDLENQKKLTKLVFEFFDSLNFKGIFNVPLEKVKMGKFSEELLKAIFYRRFLNDYKNQINQWLNSDFIKKEFPLYIKEPKLFSKGFDYFLGKNVWKEKYHHLIFLEIDGFNSFNTFYFPNDTDSIIYSRILEAISQTFLELKCMKRGIFKYHLSSFLGDEFFFCFSSNTKINYLDKKYIEKFARTVQKKIVDICSNVDFPKTKKVDVKTKNGIVSFRKMLKNGDNLDIGQISVSGVGVVNWKYKEAYTKKENEFFKNLIDDCEKSMKVVKNESKGSFRWYE